MRFRTLFALAVGAVFLLACPSRAQAAVVPMTVESMSRAASAVVVAECVSAVPRAVSLDRAARGGIVTDVAFRVTDVLSGESPDVVRMTLPGGEVDGLVLSVSEVPSFSAGSTYVLFLEAGKAVIGGTQGALVVRDGRVDATGESVGAFARRVAEATGRKMSLAEVLSATIGARARDAAESVAPLAVPVINGMTPANVSAGTGSTVTLSGTGFGATQGTGVVLFDGRGSAVVTATVVTTWSDATIVCEVPRGAGSGPVIVRTAGGLVSAGYTYDAGFSYGGYRWATPSETYRVNPNTADTSGELAMTQAAAASWSAVSEFAFIYGGGCSSTANPVTGRDGYNDVYWASAGFTSSQILAWNQYWYYSGETRIIESDIILNDAYLWGEGTSSGVMDVQSVVLHEMGHSLNLSDQYGDDDDLGRSPSTGKIMYGMMPSATQRRVLQGDDIAGVRWIYGAGGDVTPPVLGTLVCSTHPDENVWYALDDPAFSWSATDTGVISYSYSMDRIPGTLPDTVVEGLTTSASFSDLADGEWYFHVRAVDAAGNWTPGALHRRVRIDDTTPSGTMSINGGAASTATLSVDVVSQVSGASEMRVAADGVTYGAWVPYVSPMRVTLPGEVGAKTVAAQYRDLAGNVLSLQDSIMYDPQTRVLSVVEIAGADRYATALRVSQSTFPTGGCDTVLIATGANYPDALGAGGLAGAVRGPVLLVPSTGGLPSSVKNEIVRVTQGRSPRAAYIIGGTAAVSTTLENNLKSLLGSSSVKRLGGSDRFATANLVARQVKATLDAKGLPYSGEAFVVTGMAFPDALLVSPIAYAQKRPVLLVRSTVDTNLRATISAVGISRIDVVGSTAAVPSSVVTSLDAIAGVDASRVAAGTDKYATSVAVAEWACTDEGFTTDNVGIATGENFPDALAAGPMQGEARSVILLTPSASLDSRVRNELVSRYAETTHVRILGGLVAVSQTVRNAVIAALD